MGKEIVPGNEDRLLKELIFFFVATYFITWLCWIPLINLGEIEWVRMLGGFGPTLSALMLTLLMRSRADLRRLLERLKRWRVGIHYYLFSVFATAVLVIAAISLYFFLGGGPLEFNDPSQWYLIIVVFFYVLLFSVLGEEIGWRGFALPRLQRRMSALGSSLVLGFIWGLWHLPLFFVPGNFHQMIPVSLFLLQSLAISVVYTWLYNSTEGSLLIVNMFHAASNTTLGILPVLPMDTGGDILPLQTLVALLWIVAIGIVSLRGRETLSSDSTPKSV
jgi:membrane protease YdiL (CAAX protease family)